MQRRILTIAFGAALTAVACGKSVPMVAPLSPVLSSQRVFYDDQTGFPDSVRLVVKDASVWESVWGQATYNQASPPPLPPVDFTRDMIIVVGAGRMSPGDQIRVDSIGTRTDDYYVVVVKITEECQPFPADVYPLEIVRVPRDERPVVFEVRRVRAPGCT